MAQSTTSRRIKRVLSGLGMLVAGGALAAFAVVAWTACNVGASGKPDWLGNSPENIRRLTARADPNGLVFYVMGDPGLGTPTFEKLLRIVAAEEPDFLVILGDFVNEPRLGNHRFFIHEMGEQGISFPVLLVPGNHDIGPTDEFQLPEFEQTYGPAQFHFMLGDCLFLFLNLASSRYARAGNTLGFMEQVLTDRAGEARNVFVFCHLPPMGMSPVVQTHPLSGSDRFRELARKHNVRFVFSGDHHGYWKGVRDGTTYVITGGAGSPLRGTRGRFHHAVRVAIENGAIADTLFVVEREGRGMELVERNIILYVWPLLTGTRVSATLTVLGLVVVAFVGVASACWWRRLRGRAAS